MDFSTILDKIDIQAILAKIDFQAILQKIIDFVTGLIK